MSLLTPQKHYLLVPRAYKIHFKYWQGIFKMQGKNYPSYVYITKPFKLFISPITHWLTLSIWLPIRKALLEISKT